MKKIFVLIWILIIFGSNYLFSKKVETIPVITHEVIREQAMMEGLKDPSLAPVTYTLGPGDLILLDLWGNTNAAYELLVSQDGTIFIPRFEGVVANMPVKGYMGTLSTETVPPLGEIIAEGLTVGELKNAIDERVRRYFHGVSVRVSLGGLRQIPVSIHGTVEEPGAYLITPLYRLSNFIEIAGGITETGSYRNITVKRKDGSSHTYDLYEFFYKGRTEQNPYINEGDVVTIPQPVMSVKIVGEVVREGYYELKEGDRLTDIIDFAGGFRNRGGLTRVIEVYNIKNPDEVKVIDSYKLLVENDSLSNVELEAGDVIIVAPDAFTVTVIGEVMQGGTFEYEHGLTDFYYYLGLAGGYSEWANPKDVRIVRDDGTTLKWKKGVEIKLGDRIIVGRAHVRDWGDLLNVAVNVANIALIIWTISLTK